VPEAHKHRTRAVSRKPVPPNGAARRVST
jgi:hypothetical protein